MTTVRWFARPSGQRLVLRKQPRLASWNKSTDPDQKRLAEYLDDTQDLLAQSPVSAPWTLLLEVGLPAGRDVLTKANLDNYAYPLASRLSNPGLVSVWCSKHHGEESYVAIADAVEVEAPALTQRVRTTASTTSVAYKEQIRSEFIQADQIADGPVALQIASAVSRRRNWLNLWKPTIDALDPLLGRTTEARDWHPKDGRITTLGMHLTVENALGSDVIVTISAGSAKSA